MVWLLFTLLRVTPSCAILGVAFWQIIVIWKQIQDASDDVLMPSHDIARMVGVTALVFVASAVAAAFLLAAVFWSCLQGR